MHWGNLIKGASKDNLFIELNKLKWDTKLFNPRRINQSTGKKGIIQNKRARHNLCFSKIGQEAKMEEGKGTIIEFYKVPFTKMILEILEKIIGKKAKNLNIEGNKYFSHNLTNLKN